MGRTSKPDWRLSCAKLITVLHNEQSKTHDDDEGRIADSSYQAIAAGDGPMYTLQKLSSMTEAREMSRSRSSTQPNYLKGAIGASRSFPSTISFRSS